LEYNFRTKQGTEVLIDVSDYCNVIVSDVDGQEIGRMQFRSIEYEHKYYTKEFLHLCHMDFGAYKRQGIGRRCLELVVIHSGLQITASEDDGIPKDDGSHLIGDGPAFVAKMQQAGLICGGSSDED
jgi:hypothetical protein